MHIQGPLKIGATPSVLPLLVPTALALMKHSDLSSMIEVIEGLDQSLTPKLQTGSLDIVVGPVAEMFTDSPDIKETMLLRDPFCIAVGDHNRHSARTNTSLADLDGDAWVLPRKGSTYREHVEALFMTAAVPWPSDCIFANSLPLLEAMICFSNRVTIVSPVQIRPPVSGFKVIGLDGGGYRQIGYKVRAKGRLSPLGQQFVSCLQEASHNLGKNPRLVQLGLRVG
jgi:DNA-binding transcriptional LysR family regulator